MNKIKSFFSMPFGAGLAGGLAVGLLGWLAIAAGWLDSGGRTPATPLAAAPPLAEPVAAGGGLSVGQIFERSEPAVAFVEASRDGAAAETPFGPAPGEGAASGSGFLVDNEGTVLTNAHVVGNSNDVTVKLGADGETLDAEVLGTDPSTDVAVLRVDPGAVDATPLRLANSDAAKVGDAVVAIGNPFGLDRTVTTGIVSALQREISAPNGFTISDVIQTDAAINPGNSGGPLLDSRGRVIGINSQIATGGNGGGNVGVGFAVPTNTVKTISAQLIEDGDADHAFIGISGADLTPEIADLLNLDIEEGALVQEVTPDSPADRAGLRGGDATMDSDAGQVPVGGDVITAIDGERVTGMDDVIAAVNDKLPGDEISLEISRDGERMEITLQLADRPARSGS